MGARRLRTSRQRDAGRVFDDRARMDPVVKALIEHLFEVENRLRLLEGKPPVNRAAVRAGLRTKVTG